MLRIVRSSDYLARPWKNGGGTTRDIVVTPPGASLDEFHWRVSLAQVDRDGPFSRFDNVDRTLVLLDGAMTLHESDRRIDLVHGEPISFEGERAIHATLAGGSSIDFNVMTRRGRARHTVRRQSVDQRASIAAIGASTLIVFALDNGLTIEGRQLGLHDTAIVATQHALIAASAGTAAALVVEVVDIHPNVL